MSEFEDDIDDQLLELAGATGRKEKKNRKSRSSKSAGSSKKRKHNMETSDSEKDVESEENDLDTGEVADPYPFEGKYVDEEDRERLLSMPEIKREEILAERIEEKQRLQEKQVLAQMVKQQKSGGGGGGVVAGLEEDTVSKAAKRQHTMRGATKEKSRKLDELKAKRKAKDESRKRVKLSPNATRRDRSASPQDMDISSDESEDGQITKSEQEEERERRLLGHSSKSKEEEVVDMAPATLEDFNGCRLTRDLVAKWCLAPWFQDYVTGAWVRYLIGNEDSGPIYRMCEITNLAPDLVKPYKVNDRMINQAVELKHGKSVKQFHMDRISNAEFSQKEYDRLVSVCKHEDVKLPTKKALSNKVAQMHKLQNQPMTESDITAMLKRKKELTVAMSGAELMLERSRLNQARSLALKRHDHKEVEELDKQIAAMHEREGSASSGSVRGAAEQREDVLRRVNERNRKANFDGVRRAEVAEAERKRRERELAAANGGDTATLAVPVKYDPSARVKTVPRMFNAATPVSRPGTPATVKSNGGTPAPPSASSSLKGASSSGSVIRPLPSANTTMAFEQKLLETIEIDLGDF